MISVLLYSLYSIIITISWWPLQIGSLVGDSLTHELVPGVTIILITMNNFVAVNVYRGSLELLGRILGTQDICWK